MKKRILGLLAASVATVVVMAACTPAADTAAPDTNDVATEQPAPEAPDAPDAPEAPEAPAPGEPAPELPATTQDTLTIVTASLAVSLDPIQSNDSASAQANKQIYSHLFHLAYDTFDPEPALAVEWDQPDASTTWIRLRDDVFFHNGDQMTAHDVAFSLERAAIHPEVEPILGMIDRVEVHNDFELTVYTEIPFAPVIRHLAHTTAGIVPMDHILEVGEEAFAENPVGTGPFMFEHFALGDQLTLVRNPNYWGVVPVIETLIFRAVPDPGTRLIEVQTGFADVALAIAPIDVAMAAADQSVSLQRIPGLGNDYIGMNVRAPHISNPLVRQAINYAIDSETIVNAVWHGVGRPATTGFFPDFVWGHVPQAPFTHSMDRARELLIEAGYNPTPGEPGGFSTSIWWNIGNPQREQVTVIVQSVLAELNIDVTIESMEWPVYLERTAAGEQDMFILGWVSVTGDADYALFPLFHSSIIGPGGNRTFWYTAELDDLLERGRASVDPVERLAIYGEIQAIIRQEAPIVPLRWGELVHVFANNLQGVTVNPADHTRYAGAWFN